MNQYQVYLYSFECISNDDSKYGPEIPNCWHFLTFCECCYMSSAHTYLCKFTETNRQYDVNTYGTRTLVFIWAKSVSCLKFLKFKRLFHEIMNQYQACLYSLECIFNHDYKCGHEIPNCWHFLTFCKLSSAHTYLPTCACTFTEIHIQYNVFSNFWNLNVSFMK